MKNENISLKTDQKYIALDNLQDPGNLGTVIRTAEALGISSVIVGADAMFLIQKFCVRQWVRF